MVVKMKFINWIDHTMFYISVVVICYISAILTFRTFEIYNKWIWLFGLVASIIFGFFIALIWADEFGDNK